MVASKKLVRIQEKGQVTLPQSIRDELGWGKGDLVSVEISGNNVTISAQNVVSDERLRRIESELATSGISLQEMEELIEETRNRRPALMKEMYGIVIED